MPCFENPIPESAQSHFTLPSLWGFPGSVEGTKTDLKSSQILLPDIPTTETGAQAPLRELWGCYLERYEVLNIFSQLVYCAVASTAAVIVFIHVPATESELLWVNGHPGKGEQGWSWNSPRAWVELRSSPVIFAGAYAVYGLCLLLVIQTHQHHLHQNRFLLFGCLAGLGLGIIKPHISQLVAHSWICYIPATVLIALLLSLACHLLFSSWCLVTAEEGGGTRTFFDNEKVRV